MKKLLIAICTALVAVTFALALAGCDSSNSVIDAYKKVGYEVTTVSVKESDYNDKVFSTFVVPKERQKEVEGYDVIICTKGVSAMAVIVKFPSPDTIKEFLDEDAYTVADEADKIRGNCYLLEYKGTDAFNTFKSARAI